MFNNIGSHDGLRKKNTKIDQNAANPGFICFTLYIYMYIQYFNISFFRHGNGKKSDQQSGTFARTYRTEEILSQKLTTEKKTDQNHNSFLKEVKTGNNRGIYLSTAS